MKCTSFLLYFVLLLIVVPVGYGQDSSDPTFVRLQSEIARRDVVDRDPDIPADLKTTNRARLEKARTELLNVLQARIAALQKYLDTLGDSITPEEKDSARSSLKQLSNTINSGATGSYQSTSTSVSGPAFDRQTIPPKPTVPALFRRPAPATAMGETSDAAPTGPTSMAPFEIISPTDQYPTEMQQIEVFVALGNAATNNVPLKWSVNNKGKEFASGTFSVTAGRTTEKVPVPLRVGGNEITISDYANSIISKTVTVMRSANSRAKNSKPGGNNIAAAQDIEAAAAPGVETSKTPFTRAIFGLEQAAAASANPEQKLFLEFNLTAPIFRRNRKPLDAPLWLWLNPRITSLPQQLSGSVADFATASGFTSPFTSGKVNEIVQGFEFLGGIEVPIKLNGRRVTGPIDSGFGPKTKVRFGLSLLAGAGMATPFSTQKSLQVFKVNQTVIDRFPDAKGKDFIAFVSGDRNRFFRQYYGGLRLKSYYVRHRPDNPDADDVSAADSDEALDNIFPGILDVTFGQNEAVTGGELHGGVVRIDGIYPLPFISGDKKGSVYVFGSALMKLRHPKILAPVILQPPDATVAVPGANVLLQQLPTQDADHYRIGVGVDLIRLIKKP
jgi:hypothetical protein